VLAGLLDDVGRRGGALVLRGEPGIGKSALLREAARAAVDRVFPKLGITSRAQLAGALGGAVRVRAREAGIT
jgi:MoxR-like ATPase